MKHLPLLICAIILAASCNKDDGTLSDGKGKSFDGVFYNDVPVSQWEKSVKGRADLMSGIVWTPLRTMPKTYKVPDATFPEGEQVTGVPYSSVGTYNGFIGRDVSFYTFLSTVNNPKSNIYTVNYHYPPYNRDKAGPFYGSVCSAAACYVWGIPYSYFTNEISDGEVPYLDDLGTNTSQLQLYDGVCYYDKVEKSGHIIVIYGISRSKAGDIRRLKIFECAGPKARIFEYTIEQLIDWIAKYDAHIFRFKVNEYARKFSLPAFMEQSCDFACSFPEALCVSEGDRKSFPSGASVKLNILSDKYASLKVYKEGALYSETPLEGTDDVTLDALPAGKYEARLATGSNESDPTLFQICNQAFSVRRTGNDLLIKPSDSSMIPVYCSTNDTVRTYTVLIRSNDGYVAEDVSGAATHCRVVSAGEYSLVKGESIEIQ